MAKKIVFPRHVYKKGGPLHWNRGITYSKEYVQNKQEYDAALKAGYIDDFNEALLGESDTLESTDFEEVSEPVAKKTVSEPVAKKAIEIDDDF